MTPAAEVFVGRTGELTLLAELADDARRGEPRIVLIEGPGGSGKSALLRAFRQHLADFRVLVAEADELGGGVPMSLLGQLVDSSTDGAMAGALELLSLLARHQLDGPVALFVEDLHWADPRSTRALRTALRRLDDGDRVLVAITTRPASAAAVDRLHQRDERVRRLSLGPLRVEDVIEYAGQLDTPLTNRSAIAVHAHAAGHALHIATILRQVDAEQLDVNGRLPIPRSLATSTLAIVSQLDPDARRFVTALSVVAPTDDVDTVAAVAGLPDATNAVEAAAHAGLIVVTETAPVRRARFAHPMYRGIVEDDLSPTYRRQLHLAAAEAIPDVVESLFHRMAAVDRADDELATDVERVAMTIDDVDVACRLLVAAGDVSTQPDVKRRCVTAAARNAVAAGDVAMVEHLRTRLQAHASPGERDLALGWLAWQHADVAAAERLLRAAGGPTSAGGERARALLQLGSIYAMQSRGSDAIAAASAAIAEHALAPRDEQRARITVIRGIAQSAGGRSGLAALAEQFPDPWPAVEQLDPFLVRARALLHLFAGQPAQSLPWFDAAIAVGTRPDMVELLAHLHHSRGHAHHRCGTWDDALLDAHRAIELALDLDQPWILTRAHALATWVQAARGQTERAQFHLRQVRTLPAPDDSHEVRVFHAMAEAAVARAGSDLAGAIAALAPLAVDGGRHLPMSESLQFWPVLIRAHLDSGHLDEADDELGHFVAAAGERRIDQAMQVAALTGRLRAERGDASSALADFERAAALVDADTDLVDRAELHHDHGRLLLRLGRRQQAAAQLATARSLFEAMGAVSSLDRLDRELREDGLSEQARPRRTRFELTDRERDVAALVSRGMTNRQVAANLYISAKAVEYHLGNIYAKLGINSRHRLAVMFG